ncbi:MULTISPECIES: hypothetical protein [unclassified Janthinobacterium]|uniref:hypothetical protein n=1 Tax=unclassified Janthinobacterium TaxID=2610881 RepID=UPI00161A1844|nr:MULTISPECIES: hypothetical protein [unclassified Janthinobacterium]MBB5607226.1 hypothetical protein [Janthinobacterium sp. S3T4]MBB5612951.1 hypothetical protein [Janthinobacterium sp. S3M3]
MMQWIDERKTKPEPFQDNGNFRSREEFLTFLARTAPNVIETLVKHLMVSDISPEINALREHAQQQADATSDPDMLLTVACATALAKYPQLETWKKVRKIAYHSWQIEHWLANAMSAQAHRDTHASQAYVDLAILLFKQLENNTLNSESERRNKQREGACSYWKTSIRQLEELWWGLRGSDFMNYEEEMRFFGLLHEIAPEKFHQLIAQSHNPFLLDAALMDAQVTGFQSRYVHWEAAVKAAPLAFEQDGRWTGAVLLPLLLVHARAELLVPGRQIPRFGADLDEVVALSSQVSELVDAVVATLATRSDAIPMLLRWANWLMRARLGQSDDEFDDIRSPYFVDIALIKAIGKALLGQALISHIPGDAAAWEDWCYRCVRSFFAHNENTPQPSFEEFASQWRITPETWFQAEGRNLIERASPHLSSNNNAPDLLSHLLALPLTSENDYALRWQQLWDSACYLREVLEFGAEDAGPERYADQTNASRLLLALAYLGLACFDQVAGHLATTLDSPTSEIVRLHESLSLAAMEVLHIDDTINRDRWKAYLHHLALRRAFWDTKYRDDLRHPIFSDEQQPTITDFMAYIKAEPNDLLEFLHACILNQLNPSILGEELKRANIDVDAVIDELKRLHTFHAHRYPMNNKAIEVIKPLLQGGGRQSGISA